MGVKYGARIGVGVELMGEKPLQHDSPAAAASTAADIRLRPVEVSDLDFVVTQHLNHFPDGFFARLGQRFLREYYRSFITCPGAVALLAVRDDAPVGYLVGSLDPAEHRRQMLKRHGKRLAWRAAQAMALRPGLAVLFVRTRAVRYLRTFLNRAPTPPAGSSGRAGVLDYVAVAATAQAEGVGSTLIAHFEALAASAGLSSLSLVTVAGAQGAGEYYAKDGWTSVGNHRTSDGRFLTTFRKHIADGLGSERAPQPPV